MKKRILLLYGGKSSEHDVSVMGYAHVHSLLRDTEYSLTPVYIDRAGVWHLDNADGTRAYLSQDGTVHAGRRRIRVDAAIPILHGEGGEDGRIQSLLEAAGIPYVGADATASAVSIDKFYTKAVASSLGIPTAKAVIFSRKTDIEEAYRTSLETLGLPMFIKPRRLGSSVGAHPVYTKEDFYRTFPLATEKGGGLVMVEELVKGKREIECAYFRAGGRTVISEPGEILIDGFYGYREKYGGTTALSPIADVDRDTADTVKEYARALAEALSLRHLARIDFFLSEGRILFNEVNTFPGFTKDSLYPVMLEASGIHPRDALVSFLREIC